MRRFFVLECLSGFERGKVSLAFIRKYRFKNWDELTLLVQMSQRNNPGLFDGRQNSLVLSKMAQNDSIDYSSTLCVLRGEKQGKRTGFLVFGF